MSVLRLCILFAAHQSTLWLSCAHDGVAWRSEADQVHCSLSPHLSLYVYCWCAEKFFPVKVGSSENEKKRAKKMNGKYINNTNTLKKILTRAENDNTNWTIMFITEWHVILYICISRCIYIYTYSFYFISFFAFSLHSQRI